MNAGEHGIVWNAARLETLKAMLAAGKSARAIATALGGVSRNSVIGKVRRMGLQLKGRANSTLEPFRWVTWGKTELSLLTATWNSCAPVSAIAEALAPRSESSIRERAAGLRLPPRSRAAVNAFTIVSRATRAEIIVACDRDLPATDDAFAASGCRWPIGDSMRPGQCDAQGAPLFRFCQRAKTKRKDGTDSVYCEGHHAAAYQKAPAPARDFNPQRELKHKTARFG